MKIVSVLIKISYVFLAILILGLIADMLNGGTNILLPGLGLVIKGSFVLTVLIIFTVAFILTLTAFKRRLEIK